MADREPCLEPSGRRAPASLLAAFVALAVSVAAVAEPLVVASSTDPGHRPGAVIEGSDPLQVADGSHVVLIAQDGRVVRLDGPYRGAPAARRGTTEDGMLSTLSRLVSDAAGQPAMAVFRGTVRAPDTVVRLDAATVRCVDDPARISFARPVHAGDGALLLVRPDLMELRVPWPADVAEIPWPERMPYERDARYTASFADMPVIRIFTTPDGLASRAHEVAWMAERGCEDDARRALRALVR